MGLFFIWSTVCVEKTDFEQLIIRLSNETGNPLWSNYTVKGQNEFSLASCFLNSFLAIIRLIDEERLDVWTLTLNNISHTIFFDYICGEVERMYGTRTLVANI